MPFEKIDAEKILSFGVIGLGFLLALLAFWLLYKEQQKANPHKSMLTAIYAFMAFSLLLCLAGLASEFLRSSSAKAPVQSKAFAEILAEKRYEISRGTPPENFRRGDLAELAQAELVINLPAGACREYLILVEPDNQIEMNWWANGEGAREVRVSESGDSSSRTGQICTAEDDPKKSATIGLQARMVKGSGPYAIEVYFSSQVMWDAEDPA